MLLYFSKLGMQEALDYHPQGHSSASPDHTFCLRKSSDRDAVLALVAFGPQALGSVS